MVKIFIILDGVGDRACKLLDGLTPLEAAKTPNLDYFASRGNGGYVYTVNEQLAKNGNLALRTNFATVDNRLILDRRVGRTLTTKEAKELEKTINEKVKLDYDFEFRATVGHRGVLVIKGGDFSDNISNVDPAYKRVGRFGVAVNNNINNIEECRALDPERKTKVSANVVNSFVKQCHEILKNHPVNNQRNKKYLLKANAILVRDAGIILPELPKKTGWGAVVSMPLEVGIAKLSGMKVLKFDYPETTNKGLLDNLYKGLNETLAYSKIMIKKGNLSKYFIHFKELDVMGHDNNPIEKKKMIELIDKEFFGYLRKREIQ
ncbi:MAG: 2,3-bisphosphoglycerate-independent phosphoglycerate mutase [archaeon GW2011_AR18]|nr:MAG: 2,3-bisphosphoglycerate-independent phosphoglycerate mutase [archaeon GW2011_AR18]